MRSFWIPFSFRVKNGLMYLPVARTLGAVDCFMLLGKLLVAFQITSAGDHSISKVKWDELKDLAKQKGITSFWFVFIVPHWRVKNYIKKGQSMTEKGKLCLVKGPYKRDNKGTLSYAIRVLKKDGVEVGEFSKLVEKNTSTATNTLRKNLKSVLATQLREKKGFQNLELESLSVPRLLANYESEETDPSEMTQLVWPIQKSEYDNYFETIKEDRMNRNMDS